MSLFFRREKRSVITDLIPQRLPSQSFGEPVTDQTAPQVVAYGAAVNLLASIISSLPAKVFTASGEPGSRPSWLDDPSGEGYGLDDFIRQHVNELAYSGNVVWRTSQWDNSGSPARFAVVSSYDVSYQNGWRVGGEPEKSANIVHVRQWPLPGQRFGMSPIQRHATLFGLALAVERFGQQWFSEGAHPSAVLETDQVLDAEKANSIQDRVLAKMQGTRAPVALGAGLKYRPIQLAPEESQFLQTQQFTAAQVCRILGPGLAEILGYATGDSMTYKNREQLAIDLLTYTVDPILVQLERRLSAQIGGYRSRVVKFNRGALLRTDLKTRFEAHRIALGPVEPFETVNEVRAFEDMQPIQWGDDKPAVQGVPDPTEEVTP